MTLLAFILSSMLLLVPARDHSALGNAIADVVVEEAPLFVEDDSRATTLDAAREAIDAREANDGDPTMSFGRVAEMWSVILADITEPGQDVQRQHVALCMVAMKIVRLEATL